MNGDEEADIVYGMGDVFLIAFDKATDWAGVHGGKLFVDSLFTFSEPIGVDYSGRWLDASTFEVTLTDVGSAPVPVSSEMRVSTAGHVRNPARTSVAVEGAATVQTIASEAYFAPPLIAEARAIDALNNDTALGPGDQLHVAFDRETNGYAGLPAIGSGGHNLINRTC